jgi:hydroxymethylpyrimidine pyrophosphatase-like HAD family hydrolase
MKPSYGDELGLLAASYDWAAREDISPLVELLDIVASGTALYIGSGGALAVCALASALHVAKTGRLATHATPLAASGGPMRHSTAAVLFSARAGHPDVALAARAAVRQGCSPVGLVTHRRVDEIPSSLASQPITVVSYAAPFTRDGFLATNTVLTMSTLLVRWYARRAFSLPDQLRPQISMDGRSMTQNCLVLVGPGTDAAGIDLETRLSETGLAAAQLVDYRNFAHGRHYGLSRNQDRTAIVAFIAPEYADLANDTLAQLPNGVPVFRIETDQPWPVGVLELLVGSMQLIGQVSDAAGLDPARPRVPAFGRALYRLNSQSKISMVAPDPVARKLIALGAPTPSAIRTRYQVELERWTTMMSELQFDGLVLDYDGTVCTTENRFDAPDETIVKLLVNVIERGAYLGFASGRGSSLHRELRNVIPEHLWVRVYAGMYNGALVIPLNADIPDASSPNPVLEELWDRVRELVNEPSVLIERRAHQIQFQAATGGEISTRALAQLIRDMAARAPSLEVKCVQSAHSIDVVEATTSKRAVVETIGADCSGAILCIGDQGQEGGNDYELLACQPATLSVDRCSSDPTRCWNLGLPGERGPSVLRRYLRSLRHARGRPGFRWSY